MITDKTKIALIEQFKQMPIIEVACKKVGIGRATFYRWKKSNKEFAKLCDEALGQGRLFINDLAESQLLQAIKEGNMTGVIFWLKNNHRNYGTKIEIKGKIKTDHADLTKEQKQLIREALKRSVLIEKNNDTDANSNLS